MKSCNNGVLTPRRNRRLAHRGYSITSQQDSAGGAPSTHQGRSSPHTIDRDLRCTPLGGEDHNINILLCLCCVGSVGRYKETEAGTDQVTHWLPRYGPQKKEQPLPPQRPSGPYNAAFSNRLPSKKETKSSFQYCVSL